jgi:hypothetical protein
MGQLVTLASVGEENLPFAEDVLERGSEGCSLR